MREETYAKGTETAWHVDMAKNGYGIKGMCVPMCLCV